MDFITLVPAPSRHRSDLISSASAGADTQEKSGIKILPLGKWLEELPFEMNTT
jgi:hypothetical protein